MQTVPDKSQRPQTEQPVVCRRCGGKGIVTVMVKGEQRAQPCIACRGTGQAGRGFLTK